MSSDLTGARTRDRSVALLFAVVLQVFVACGTTTEPPPDTVPAVASVSVSPATLELYVGDVVSLRSLVYGASGDTLRGVNVAWTSDDTSRASVAPNGSVLARAVGNVSILATAGGKVGRAQLSIRAIEAAAPTITALVPSETPAGGPALSLEVRGSGFQASARVYWNGSLRPTTTIDSTRLTATLSVTDVAEIGTAEVRVVNAESGRASGVLPFRIVAQPNPVRHLTLRPALSMTLVAAPVLLTATALDAAERPVPGRLITFTSSNQLVATVDGTGKVTPVGEGEVVITAQSEGQLATSVISVQRDSTYHMLASDGQGLVALDMRLGTPPTAFWKHWPGSQTTEPTPSPDGRYIAYTIAERDLTQIAILDRFTRTYQFLANSGIADQPAWSPNGEHIAFRRVENGRSHIWTIRPDGTNGVRLTDDMPASAAASHPAWSPDGRRIVFAVRSDAGVNGLYIMNADGSGKRGLTFGTFDSEPAWRGDVVVFTRVESAGAAPELWRLSVSGIGPTVRLAADGAHSAAWSPDGRWIAYVQSSGAAVGAIMAMRPFGEDKRLISGPADGPTSGGLAPVWVVHR